MTKDRSLNYSWASAEQLPGALAVEEKSGSKWPHPKAFFEEALQYNRLLLAWDGDVAVAYLIFDVLWGNTAFASLLKVLPDYQSIGIGKSMMLHLEERLVSLGFKSYVASTEAVNAKTRAAFPHLGFVCIGELQMAHGGEIFYLKNLV